MAKIEDIAALEALYDLEVNPMAITKVRHALTPHYISWIEAAKFVILATVGPEGTDASPRGDNGPVVKIADQKTLLLPDWRGNNRLDSLRNIVRDGRVSLMFMVNGEKNVVRVNGVAELRDDADLVAQFEQRGMHPRSVIVVTIGEVYMQCAKAILRSRLWEEAGPDDLPTAGMFHREVDVTFDAVSYDADYEEYSKSRMW